ncbi:hypothetical protein [Thermoflexus sp.]|uniref:hypothetical protein n=1 Tax=Thermoflexus sp. TaxID=1969742 RepID=UPI003320EAAB
MEKLPFAEQARRKAAGIWEILRAIATLDLQTARLHRLFGLLLTAGLLLTTVLHGE